MKWLGGAPKTLTRVREIWPDDAKKLTDRGIKTVRDLVDRVRSEEGDGGLDRLNEETQVPVEQLRFYFQISEREVDTARWRARGTVALVVATVVFTVLAGMHWPDPKTEDETAYETLLAKYRADSIWEDKSALNSLAWVDSLETLDGLSAARRNLVSLRAAMYHDQAVGATDLVAYDTLSRKAAELNARLRQTDSHSEHAIENTRVAIADDALLRPRLEAIPDSAPEAQNDSLNGSENDPTGERLNRVESSLVLIGDTLSDHTEKLDELLIRAAQTGTAPPDEGPEPAGPAQAEVEGTGLMFPRFWATYRDMTSALNAVVGAIDLAGTRRVRGDLTGSGYALVEAHRHLNGSAFEPCDEGTWPEQWTDPMPDIARLLCENRRHLQSQMEVAEAMRSRRAESGDVSEREVRSGELVRTWTGAQAAYDQGREEIERLLASLGDGGAR
ncbi:MAG: hypothetical protein HKN72_17575 [Gemmatimonadetes bacterium]|nr:hypothetical protein [Gemmatimonadota bacterium]